MTVKDIVKDYLQTYGFDGLCQEDMNCGCEIDNLCPCDDIITNCQPGYKVECDDEDCEYYDFSGPHWHIQVEKPKKLEEL